MDDVEQQQQMLDGLNSAIKNDANILPADLFLDEDEDSHSRWE